MEVVFRTKKLAKTCSTWAAMVRAFGPEMARRLGARLTELDQAASLAEMRLLPQARAHQLTADRDEAISLDLAQPYRLIILANHDPVPRLPDRGLDWDAVTAVLVTEIVNTHE